MTKTLNYTPVKKVSARACKLYDSLGLTDTTSDGFLGAVRKLFVKDHDSLKKLCNEIFEDNFDGIQIDDYDLEKVLEGIINFGERALGLFRGFRNYKKE